MLMFHLRLMLAILACSLRDAPRLRQANLRRTAGRESPDSKSAVRDLDAAERKDFERLDSYHFYGPKFTKFGTSGGRLDAAEARLDEHQGLAKIADLSMKVNDLKIDVLGNAGIATFIMDSEFRRGTNIFHQSGSFYTRLCR